MLKVQKVYGKTRWMWTDLVHRQSGRWGASRRTQRDKIRDIISLCREGCVVKTVWELVPIAQDRGSATGGTQVPLARSLGK